MVVPQGVQSGYINVVVNSTESNYLPIEVIPTVVSVAPTPVSAGDDMTVRAYGVGNNVNLTYVEFYQGSNLINKVRPDYITYEGDLAVIALKAPYNGITEGIKVGVEYDRWTDKGTVNVNVVPHIVRAGINMDTKILSIIGYGFSISPRENVITYKYVDEDQTVIDPEVKMLGVYPVEEGQEIRIKILDNYHYGRINVQVGDNVSNEVNFGPITVASIARRVEYIDTSNSMMGVLYISGYNFGSGGGVLVGETWADVHYRSDFFIIAVVPEANVYDGPVIVARE